MHEVKGLEMILISTPEIEVKYKTSLVLQTTKIMTKKRPLFVAVLLLWHKKRAPD